MMKRILISIAALGLLGLQGIAVAGDPAEMSETCIECHEIDEFEGMSAEEIAAATTEANANSKQMAKATADLSAEDLQAIIDYIAAEANK
jgi:mono/diheme cytochrome c family protein